MIHEYMTTIRRFQMPTYAKLALFAFLSLPAAGWAGAFHAEYVHGVAAEIGTGKIGVEQVFELWGPVWYETLTRVRNGRLGAEEGDAKLQREWDRSLSAMIKDELFYQEAEREHNSAINHYADLIYRQDQAGNAYPRTRAQIAAKVREDLKQNMNRVFRELTSELVRDSGGLVKLRKVLEGRGVTYRDWEERLRRKAFTHSYLTMTLGPRAPAPGPRRIQEYYAENTGEFSIPGAIKFRHIYFSKDARGGDEQAREAVSGIWELLIDKEIDFADAAARHSDDEVSAARGGMETEDVAADPEREAWLADIRAALREETPGQLAPILESAFGYHLAELVSIGPDRKIPFAEVRKDIERKLEGEAFQAEADKHFAAIKRNTDIRVLMPAFPPQLSCAAQQIRPQDVPAIYRVGEAGIPGLY